MLGVYYTPNTDVLYMMFSYFNMFNMSQPKHDWNQCIDYNIPCYPY